jgi:hypothetical protein
MHLGLMHMSDDAHEALVACDYRKIEHEVDELLRMAGFPALDHQGAQFGRLCRKFLVAKQKYTRIEADRWDGVYQERYVNGAVFSNSGPVNPMRTITAVKVKPFFEVVNLYFNENTRATRTDAQVKAELERFIEVLGTGGGERDITSISKADCRTYKESMLQTRGLSLATCIKHLSSLSGV